VLHHHERYDGMGYPGSFSGEEIPVLSRIITVADSFDAMTSMRPYKAPMAVDTAVNELIRGKWSQFDGSIVDEFIKLINTDPKMYEIYSNRITA
jgi:HD-GYP domain-containing protein (c-di-GMP phosphodiesterase class II)